jgi:Domain of unknown function (DUF4412)
MKTRNLLVLILTACAARADFSYTMTRKGGPAAAGNTETKHYYKGQKMRTDTGSTATILDFDAQTMTLINNTQKTYTVTKFADMGKNLPQTDMSVNADVRETGQHKTINGFNASQLVMTMNVDNPQLEQRGMKVTMEMEIWISLDVPGAGDMHAFYQRNGAKFPWMAVPVGPGGNPGMQSTMANLQKKLATMNGVPVLEVMHMKTSGGAADAAQAAQSDPRMAQARAKLEEMIKQGGPQADAAKQALARMGGATAAGAAGGMEITMESGNFSNSSIPDSVFAIPAGYQQK